MTTRHKPSPHLCSLLADLLARAEAHPGQLQTVRLTNNLKVDVTIENNHVHLQISRSSRYPATTDWAMILRHWPYPIQVRPTSEQRYGRRYFSAHWRSQIGFNVAK
jgi:hypothetical protein